MIVAAAALFGASAAGASPPEVGHFDGSQVFEPHVAADMPCLEGKEFVTSGGSTFRGTFVSDEDGFFHVTVIEKFFGTAIPVDGQGPTYVEAPNVNKVNFTVRIGEAGDRIVRTNLNNDRFIGYLDGERITSATIRIHEVEHVVGVDTDGDGEPDALQVSVNISKFSCPDS